jgi:hypothetical protein
MRRPSITRRTSVAFGLALALVVAACGDDDSDASDDGDGDATTSEDQAVDESPYAGYESEQYAGDANWLCRPGIEDDVCSRDLDATVIHADGTTEVERHEPAEDPPVDCFYVYPTTSYDDAPNSDLEPGEAEEIFTAYNQAARLTAACRVFAPVYRQVTLSMIGGGRDDVPEGVDPGEVAYDDVLDAFRHYVANESEGRSFVLVGHSQGANLLRRLVAEEIDDEPTLRDRLVSAVLLGWSVTVPEGEVVGGDFQSIPLCEASGQTGCIVSYASFRSTAPPPENSFFGRPRDGDGVAACINPARPEGGSGTLQPYFLVDTPEGTLLGGTSGAQPFADPGRTEQITTPFVTYPDFVEAECVTEGEFTYLSLMVQGDPSDPRTDDIGGDLSPEWGMHLVDANVAMGNLVNLVQTQAEAMGNP